MLMRVSPRWMVNTSQVRAIGHDPDDDEGVVQVDWIDGSSTGFMCDSIEERDHYLAEIEEVFCPKKLFNQIEEEL